jgi:energy-coupling factor transporter ATP-binding protein EcfA2
MSKILRKKPQKWFDEKYSKEEVNIDIRKENIRNVLGAKSNLHGSLKIEGFTKLIFINLKKLKLTSLEIINCPQLKDLFVSQCPNLTKLDLSHSLNELTDLDVSNLIELDCSNTSIKKLSLNLCPDLIRLNCSNNSKLINLDVSNCFKLEFLDCSNCSNSKFTSLDLRNCPESIKVEHSPTLNIIRKKENFRNILIIGHTGSGKSTLANVLTGTKDFKETEYGVSKTKNSQKGVFEWNETKYRVIDTVGIRNTKLSIDKVLHRTEEAVNSVPKEISQILFVVAKNFTDEISTLSQLGLTKSHIFEYITIVRTNFSNFKNKEMCEKDEEELCKENKTNAEIVKLCKGIIHVDNSPTNILSYDDDDDDNDKETNININKNNRKKSRTILLKHLDKVCKGKALQIDNINIQMDAHTS